MITAIQRRERLSIKQDEFTVEKILAIIEKQMDEDESRGNKASTIFCYIFNAGPLRIAMDTLQKLGYVTEFDSNHDTLIVSWS